VTTIRCPHCGQTFELSPEQVPQYAGRTITCTMCKQPFTVEIPGTIDVAPPPPPLPSSSYTPGYAERQAAYAQHPPQYPQQSYPPQPQQHVGPQQSNGLAVGSLVMGIVGFIIPVIGGLVAIVLGILGLTKTKDPRVGGKGMAIAGIIIGAVSMVVTPCCISILLPSLNRARETANRVKCASNMKQIGNALLVYANANRGQYPPDLVTLLNNSPALGVDTMTCPSSSDTPATSAATLNAGGHLSYIYVPGMTTRASSNAVLLYEPLTNHTNDGINILFGDGHVEFLLRAQAQPIITAVESGQNPTLPPGY
jgi:prepilin-type processing-associated H-X9-DG protein